MITVHKTVSADLSADSFSLEIQLSALELTVKAGTFRVQGEEYELLEDQEFVVEPPVAGFLSILGYVVQERATGDVLLLVDECPDGEMGYTDEELFERLHLAVWVVVPPGTTDLEDLEVNVHQIVGKE